MNDFNRYIQNLVHVGSEIVIKYNRIDANHKPIFELIGYIANDGIHNIVPISEYITKFKIGQIVNCKIIAKDTQDNVIVYHNGMYGQIRRIYASDMFLNQIKIGDTISARICDIENNQYQVWYSPIFFEDISNSVRKGKIKVFYSKVIKKDKGIVGIKLDGGGYLESKMTGLGYFYIHVGESYFEIGYSCTKSNLYFNIKNKFEKFKMKYEVGQIVYGFIIDEKGKVALVDKFAGFIVNTGDYVLQTGSKHSFIIDEINENSCYVNFKLMKDDIER